MATARHIGGLHIGLRDAGETGVITVNGGHIRTLRREKLSPATGDMPTARRNAWRESALRRMADARQLTEMANQTNLEALVALAVESGSEVDVIVNNAGISPISYFDELRVADLDAMTDVNLRGTLYGIAAALPVFQRQ